MDDAALPAGPDGRQREPLLASGRDPIEPTQGAALGRSALAGSDLWEGDGGHDDNDGRQRFGVENEACGEVGF
jgi:hypothetical protein